jgi:hypothetical protein
MGSVNVGQLCALWVFVEIRPIPNMEVVAGHERAPKAGQFFRTISSNAQGSDLPFDLLEGGALRGDEPAPILASGVSQESNPDAGWVIWGSRPYLQLEGS